MILYSIIVLLIIHIVLFLQFPNPLRLKRSTYDVCIILGSPSNPDGSLSETQKKRMDAAIALVQQHKASYLIISGSNVANEHIEAITMSEYAKSQNIPSHRILLETNARNTYENLLFSKTICEQYHFKTILVVTSIYHTRRASFFVKKFFQDFAMVPTKEAKKLSHYIDEYFRLWNTLYYECKLKMQSKN